MQSLPSVDHCVLGIDFFGVDIGLARPVDSNPQSPDQKSTTIVNMENNNAIPKVNLEDLPDNQKALIE